MTDFLSYTFQDDEAFISTFDEVPLWSASFGLLLLKHLEPDRNITVLDIGSGTGFPLLELAGRFGRSCKFYGVDPWKNANARSAQKILNYGLTNVELIESTAEQLPFGSNSIDLIVSNLGINNFDHPGLVFAECNRVLKPGGKLALTSNLNGHWKEFYAIFEHTLTRLNKNDILEKIQKQQIHRGTVETLNALYTQNGFTVTRFVEEQFEMRFADGTAFLNHYFVKLGWLLSWLDAVPKEDHGGVFGELEKDLNDHAMKQNGLTLTVPMIFMEGQK